MDRWEKRKYVYLSDGGEREGAVAVRVGVNMLNSAKITDTSAVHLECFQ